MLRTLSPLALLSLLLAAFTVGAGCGAPPASTLHGVVHAEQALEVDAGALSAGILWLDLDDQVMLDPLPLDDGPLPSSFALTPSVPPPDAFIDVERFGHSAIGILVVAPSAQLDAVAARVRGADNGVADDVTFGWAEADVLYLDAPHDGLAAGFHLMVANDAGDDVVEAPMTTKLDVQLTTLGAFLAE